MGTAYTFQAVGGEPGRKLHFIPSAASYSFCIRYVNPTVDLHRCLGGWREREGQCWVWLSETIIQLHCNDNNNIKMHVVVI